VAEAFPPMAVVITLDDDIAVSRGDILCRPNNRPTASHDIEATVCWMDDRSSLAEGRSYLLKHSTRTVRATAQTLHYRLDINGLHRDETAPQLELNEVGRLTFRCTEPLLVDDYTTNRSTGSFIIIDPTTNATVGAGVIRVIATTHASPNVVRHEEGRLSRQDRFAALGSSGAVLSVVMDVSKKDQVEALIAAAVREFGRVDIMVNNAGIAMIQDFLDVTKADYDKVLGVNLEGAFWGTQAAARQMIAQGEGGVIINMSSINSGLANPRVATYAITKGGMNQITGTAAVAFARNGIRVVGVGPGTIDTEMVRGEFVSDATEQAILSRTPLGRYGTAAEIAAVVAFLASDDASYITGETIYPDGGRRVLNYAMPNKQ